MKEDCIFCKIIKGDIPSFTIYEDKLFKVILDRFPAAPGHALIIPKEHYKDIFELPEEVAQALYPLAKEMATRIKLAVDAEGMNIVQNNGEVAGQSVYHFHLHLVPRKAGDGITLNKSANSATTLEELEAVLKCIQAVK
ncbi:HIT family protein [Cellulosilyticum sp. ST5]|uniref:Histidine triad (HIT) protein n=1 Tax=Cellulosilyticum lentocellum (strain ATCC 49066 / DSM 5427 / NCIMB 11756 / RHM5) TaxID=642492 RepID=F2JRG9_CELLD|nr:MULTISPECIES: HIT family protein [Cellulosilyticum]ADZ82778.1 histidine triad (HIT) protein [Cellulosilyticum lentocellum DSM 5427]